MQGFFFKKKCHMNSAPLALFANKLKNTGYLNSHPIHAALENGFMYVCFYIQLAKSFHLVFATAANKFFTTVNVRL